MNDLLKKQLKGYIISGLLATGSDFIIYNLLTHFVFGYNISKSISFLVGTLVAFFYNKYITFDTPHKSVVEICKFFILYIVSMVCNVSANHMGIMLLSKIISVKIAMLIAFLFATLVSMSINFIGQKYWVFKK